MKKSNEALNEKIYKQFQKGLDFNNRIDLCDNVETSENFFIGRQWEGVQSNGLPTPVFNFLKHIVLHQVANITSDNITMNAKPLAAALHGGARCPSPDTGCQRQTPPTCLGPSSRCLSAARHAKPPFRSSEPRSPCRCLQILPYGFTILYIYSEFPPAYIL